MISLFLDTSSYKIIVGIYNNTNQLVLNIEDNDNHLSERIMPLIDKSLKQAELKIDDIDNIFVVNGPGSFTGIRIGVTVAKTIAWASNKKIFTISELEVLAETTKNYKAALIDARRGYVYAGLYDSNGNNIVEDQYIELTKFMDKIKEYKDVEFVSYDTIKVEDLKEPELNITKIIERHLNDETLNSHSVNPNYLKLTEAEEKLNDKDNK